MDTTLHWNPKKTFSYNCLFNFVVGMRGGGKTYGGLYYGINDVYLKNKERGKLSQILYVRRMSTELKKLTTNRNGRLFNAVKNEFPDHKLHAESNTLYCDGEVMGYAQSLSTASLLKSDPMPNVDFIFFDEFIIDNRGTYHYLPDEVTKFLDLYETVSRGRDVKVLFAANAVTITNPYFDYFHLNKPANGKFQRFGQSKDILVENYVNPSLSVAKQNTRFGQIIAGSEYSDYAYNNEYLLDNEDFVERKTQRAQYYLTLKYKDSYMGIWFDPEQWLYYVSSDVDLQYGVMYAVTLEDHTPNVMLFKTGRKMKWIKALQDAYECGAVRYESMKLKNWFRDIMRMSNAS